MDRIEGVPEGYRLGRVTKVGTTFVNESHGWELVNKPKSITFELIPIEPTKQLEAVEGIGAGEQINVPVVTIREREKGVK